MAELLAQGMNLPQILLLIVVAVAFLTFLAAIAVMWQLFHLWLRAFLSGANIPLPLLLLMKLRKVPVKEIVRLRIMAVQSGVNVSLAQIERAYLAGADVERAVLAMVRAKEQEKTVSWDELMSADVEDRLSRRP